MCDPEVINCVGYKEGNFHSCYRLTCFSLDLGPLSVCMYNYWPIANESDGEEKVPKPLSSCKFY